MKPFLLWLSLVLLINLALPWMMTSPTSSASLVKVTMVRMVLLHHLLLCAWSSPSLLPPLLPIVTQARKRFASLLTRLHRLVASKLFWPSSIMVQTCEREEAVLLLLAIQWISFLLLSLTSGYLVSSLTCLFTMVLKAGWKSLVVILRTLYSGGHRLGVLLLEHCDVSALVVVLLAFLPGCTAVALHQHQAPDEGHLSHLATILVLSGVVFLVFGVLPFHTTGRLLLLGILN